MYVTAHRVQAPNGERGINAFLHLHGDSFPWPADPSSLPEADPGRIARKSVAIPPGGNTVLSYLDVLARDGTPPAKLARALRSFEAALDEKTNPAVLTRSGVTIRFGAVTRRGRGPERLSELRALFAYVEWLITREER
jgi:uncharacterized protein YbjT (DUF2867 family)